MNSEKASSSGKKPSLNFNVVLDKMKQGGGAVVGGIKTTTHTITEGGKTAATKVVDTGMSAGKAMGAPISNLRLPYEKSTRAEAPDAVTTAVDKGASLPEDGTRCETPGNTESSVQTGSATSVKSTARIKSDTIESSTLALMLDTVKQSGETVALGLKNTSNKISEGSKNAAKKITETMEKALNVSKTKAIIITEDEVAEGDLPPVLPDEALQKMDIIISKRLKGLTIAQFHDTVWAEDRVKPFHKNWLESSGKNEVQISDWQIGYGDSGEGDTASNTGPWDGEIYDKHRIVNFRFTRTTHLFSGPPVAEVKHTQFCRVESREKCVLGMQIEMQGIPFADCFNVQIRWVAKRMGTETDLKIQVGLFVNFVQQTVLAGKIRSGTSEETTKTQLSLFQAIKEACSEVAGGVLEEEDDDEDTAELVTCFELNDFLLQWFGKYHWLIQWFGARRNDDVSKKAQSAKTKLKKIQHIWNSSMKRHDSDHIIASELTDIHASLDKILRELETTK